MSLVLRWREADAVPRTISATQGNIVTPTPATLMSLWPPVPVLGGGGEERKVFSLESPAAALFGAHWKIL